MAKRKTGEFPMQKSKTSTLQQRVKEYVAYLNAEHNAGWEDGIADKFVEFAQSELTRAKFERVGKPIVCHQCDVGGETMIEMSKHFSETGHTGCSVRIGA